MNETFCSWQETYVNAGEIESCIRQGIEDIVNNYGAGKYESLDETMEML